MDRGSCAATAVAFVGSTKPRAVLATPDENMSVTFERMGQESALFHAYLADLDHVEVLAAASTASESAYAGKVMPKGKSGRKE